MSDQSSKKPDQASGVVSQSQIFLESEGDGWFQRNRASLMQASGYYDTDIIKRVLNHDKAAIRRVLEIGSGNGAKLHDLCTFFEAEGCGIDPSAAAVDYGNKHHHRLKLSVATASKLPYTDDCFDLVYFGFCLYLLDRNDLFKAVAEADRVLKKGGYLAILDFDPRHRHKRPYHHLPGLYSYKTSYADFFTGGGHYYLVAKESFSHSGTFFTKDSDERVSVSILFKEPDAY